MEENKLKNSLQRIPDVVKGWLGLIIAIAGIVIALRADRQLYSVIIVGVILTIWLFIAIYIIRARIPGTFSKKGLYRYENYRWAGFLSIGTVIGIIFAFSLFTPNRQYVYEAFVGTPTTTPSRTPTSAPSPTLTITTTPTPTLPPTAIFTETLSPTPIPAIIFQDDFTYNKQGWDPNHSLVSLGNPTFYGDVTNGELKYAAACSGGSPCISYFNIPRVQERDFDLQFDATLTKCVDLSSPCVIVVRFRDANSQFYTLKFFNNGLVSMYRNDTQISERKFLPQLDQGNGPNHFRIIAHDANFKIYAGKKGEEVTEPIEFTDGNNSFIGAVSLGAELKDGHVATIIFDNVLLQEVQ
jgi:hypothetical protein